MNAYIHVINHSAISFRLVTKLKTKLSTKRAVQATLEYMTAMLPWDAKRKDVTHIWTPSYGFCKGSFTSCVKCKH